MIIINLIDKLDNKLLSIGYKIYNSEDDKVLYKRINNSTEEFVEVYSQLLVVGIKTDIDRHKSFYPLSNFIVEGIEDVIKTEKEQFK